MPYVVRNFICNDVQKISFKQRAVTNKMMTEWFLPSLTAIEVVCRNNLLCDENINFHSFHLFRISK